MNNLSTRARGELPRWPAVKEVMNLQNPQLFIEFRFIWPNNIKFVERKKSIFFTYNIHFPAP